MMRKVTLAVLLMSAWILVSSHGLTNQTDVRVLNKLYTTFNSPPQLTGWSRDPHGDPCGQQWKGVACSGSSVIEIFSKLGSHEKLVLTSNRIIGEVPSQLPPSLQRLDLSDNLFAGSLPEFISGGYSLEYLNVSQNKFGGSLDIILSGVLPSLTTFDLSQNKLGGSLPKSFGGLSRLTSLYLQDNQFAGTIDVLVDLPLENLNVENNRFTGRIPEQLKNIKNFQSRGNQWNTGAAPPFPRGNSNVQKSGLNGGGIAGIIIASLALALIVAFIWVKRKPEMSTAGDEESQAPASITLGENTGAELAQDNPDPVIANMPRQLPSPLSITPPSLDHPKSVGEEGSSSQQVTKTTDIFNIGATAYSIDDLEMATGGFAPNYLIGKGSIGHVYRADFDDGKVLAVKKIHSLDNSQQASKDFLKVVLEVSTLHHAHLTELVGYCCEGGQYLLAFEFHRNGSLHDFLHLLEEHKRPLTWNNRAKIALGIAYALEYLHEGCSPSIVHKNFKSANILLDKELSPHLSDCGLLELTSDGSQALDQYLASGYHAPEVTRSGECTVKDNVFSFGVLMLELLTGRKPFDSLRPRHERSLVRWARPQLYDMYSLNEIIDPALKGLCPANSVSRLADAIGFCIHVEPEFRPVMSEVVHTLVHLVEELEQRGAPSK